MIMTYKPGFHFDFFAFCCLFWFFAITRYQNEQCNLQMETSTKTKTSNKKPKCATKPISLFLVFEIELILSRKQERARRAVKATNDK